MPIQYGTQYKPPKVTYPGSAQAKKNTTGYRDPFPSLSSNAVGSPSRMQQQAPKAGGYGQPAKPPAQFSATQPQQPAPAAPQTPKLPGYSYDSDPVLNQINALTTQSDEDAQANATKLRTQLATQYGDVDLARMTGGDTLAQTVGANPNSIYAQLAHGYQLGQEGLESQLNDANLFYSGARVKQLGELAGQYGTQRYNAAGELGSQWAGVEGALNSAQNANAKARLQAQIDAAARAAAAAAAAGGQQVLSGNLNPGGNPILNTGGPGTGLGGETPGEIAGAPTYPNLDPNSPTTIYTPVTVGSQTSAEPRGRGPQFPGQPGSIRQGADSGGASVTPDGIAQAIAQIQGEQTGGRPVTPAGQAAAAPVARQAQQQIISQGPPPGLIDQVGPMSIDNGVVSQQDQGPLITQNDIAQAIAGLTQEETGGMPITQAGQQAAAPIADEVQQNLIEDPFGDPEGPLSILNGVVTQGGGGPPLIGVPRRPGKSGARPLL